MSEKDASQIGSILIALCIGALAGAGLALLYAPRTGKATRHLMADKGRQLKDKAEETFHDAQEFIGDKKDALLARVGAA